MCKVSYNSTVVEQVKAYEVQTTVFKTYTTCILYMPFWGSPGMPPGNYSIKDKEFRNSEIAVRPFSRVFQIGIHSSY